MADFDALEQRIKNKVVRGEDGCWLWTGNTTSKGYGMLKRPRSRKTAMVYRYVYEQLVGPIPDGMVMDHLCRTPACCNPDHVEPVTQAQNVHRGRSHVNEQATRTHCPQGHPLDGTNLYVQVRRGIPHRSCRICRADANARRAARVAAA